MLSNEQVEFYEGNGYVLVEDAVGPEQLSKMQQIAGELIETSCEVAESNDIYDFDEGHSRENPKLTRIKLPQKQHSFFWEVLRESRITEILRQLLGDNVILQTTKLNTKAPGGGAAVEWHQDWAIYPHSNDDLLACGLFLDDVNKENGPLQVILGSHKGPVLSNNSAQGVFCGAIDPDDSDFRVEKAVTLTGNAGSMTVHHVRTIHGSQPNLSDRSRMVLFYECAAADAWPLMGANNYMQLLSQDERWADLLDRVVIGEPELHPRME